MNNNPVESEWLEAEAALRRALGNSHNASCLIPGWEPVDLATGLHWLKTSIYEGYYVKFRIDEAETCKIVKFKIWEYGEDEPAE